MRAVGRLGLFGAAVAIAVSVVAFGHPSTGLAVVDPSSLAVRTATTRLVAATERKLAYWQYSFHTSGDSWVTWGPGGWTSGYLPGELWTSYALTGDTWFRDHAASRQTPLGKSVGSVDPVDIGMRYFYSYVQGYQLTGNKTYRTMALEAATSEARLYNPAVGALRSTQATDSCEVIVDDLVNVQLLEWGADNGGPASWREMAHRHALTTARDFVRDDGSVAHLVSYDATTGAIESTETQQALFSGTAWARGQAWAICGFTSAYKSSRDTTLLATARRVAERYLADLPADSVPYWDFRDADIPDAPKDSSAAAIAASGLLDLATVDPNPTNRVRYENAARDMLASLTSPSYFSTGTVPAILLHGTMNYFNPATVDCGQSFGDYFFLEALLRLRGMPTTQSPMHVRRAFANSGTARYVLDGRASTACTSKGKRWIDVDLGARRTVRAVGVAVQNGSTRSAPLKFYTSYDRRRWHLVTRAVSSGETSSLETYVLPPTRARFVRLSLSGTSRGSTNAISELRVY
ncbi:MAG TPA: discoidin domain-containing protein [Coriobacteriia bacterium]